MREPVNDNALVFHVCGAVVRFMEPEVLPEAQKLVQLNESILRRHHHLLGKDARILDFGCGGGRHVYEYLDAGFIHLYRFAHTRVVLARRPR